LSVNQEVGKGGIKVEEKFPSSLFPYSPRTERGKKRALLFFTKKQRAYHHKGGKKKSLMILALTQRLGGRAVAFKNSGSKNRANRREKGVPLAHARNHLIFSWKKRGSAKISAFIHKDATRRANREKKKIWRGARNFYAVISCFGPSGQHETWECNKRKGSPTSTP